MLIDILKNKIHESIKSTDEIAKNSYRFAYSEIERASLKKPLSELEQLAILKKIIKNNEQTISLMKENNFNNEMELNKIARENEILKAFLPKELSVDDIISLINDNNIDFSQSKSEGQSLGIVMKFLKSKSISAEPTIVKQAISKIMEVNAR